jgi:hypothetical protein
MFPRLSKDIVQASFPDMEISLPNALLGRQIFNTLPPLSEAIKLCELYMEHGKYT